MSDNPLKFCPACDQGRLVLMEARRVRGEDYPEHLVEEPFVFQICANCAWDNFREKYAAHGRGFQGS